MQDGTLKRLSRSIGRWRKYRGHRQERIPGALAEQIQRAVEAHGLKEVVKITGPMGYRIARKPRPRGEVFKKAARSRPSATPAYSRLDFDVSRGRALAEVETPLGYKLRVFDPEAIGLLRELVRIPSAKEEL